MISALKSCFAQYGIPEDVISDNGSQFTSQEYQLFGASYGFKLTTSSPHYPRGHGFVEQQVQTIKKLLTKCIQDGSDPFLALLQLRTTPIDSRTPSTSELLQNRKLHTTLPVNIRPPPNSEATRASLQAMQTFSHHDANAKMIDLIPRQPVWVQDPHTRTWYEGAIVSKAETPRSYIVQTKSGIVRRNRIHLRERIPAVKDQKVVRLQVKPKEMPKVPVIQESINRPSVVKVPLVKSENESIKESEKEGKIPRFVPKVEQKEEKKSESEEVMEKSEAQNPRVGHNNATPTISASQAPDLKPNPIPPVEPRRSVRAHKPNPRYMDTTVKEIGNTIN